MDGYCGTSTGSFLSKKNSDKPFPFVCANKTGIKNHKSFGLFLKELGLFTLIKLYFFLSFLSTWISTNYFLFFCAFFTVVFSSCKIGIYCCTHSEKTSRGTAPFGTIPRRKVKKGIERRENAISFTRSQIQSERTQHIPQ